MQQLKLSMNARSGEFLRVTFSKGAIIKNVLQRIIKVFMIRKKTKNVR
jgi:hypothetical protein